MLNELLLNLLIRNSPPAMIVPAIVTARHPYLLTNPDDTGPGDKKRN